MRCSVQYQLERGFVIGPLRWLHVLEARGLRDLLTGDFSQKLSFAISNGPDANNADFYLQVPLADPSTGKYSSTKVMALKVYKEP